MIPREFIKVMQNATPTDVLFSKVQIVGHSEAIGPRIGHIPKEVSGISIPTQIKVSYVEGCDNKGKYWYVVSWAEEKNGRHCEFEVATEAEAKTAVFHEILKYLRKDQVAF